MDLIDRLSYVPCVGVAHRLDTDRCAVANCDAADAYLPGNSALDHLRNPCKLEIRKPIDGSFYVLVARGSAGCHSDSSKPLEPLWH